jgi:hypothetical protein
VGGKNNARLKAEAGLKARSPPIVQARLAAPHDECSIQIEIWVEDWM